MFKYFGSKCRSSKHYPAPLYPTICEPFAGGAGYSRRYTDRDVVLFDLDDEIIRLWRWLIVADPAEIRALPHESLYVGQDIRTLGLRPEAADLVRRWQRTGHCSCWTVSKFNHIDRDGALLTGPVPNGTVGRNSGMWHPNTREYLARAVETIRHWHAYCMSYQDIPVHLAHPMTWFVDPPYQQVRGTSYKHSKVDYDHLAHWCQHLPGQVIVCEQEGADWLPFTKVCEISGIRGKMRGVPGAKSQEVMWYKLS